ncbi:hypothetical protein K1719_032943 [Acacia pycnantha]|nr:hypothetical protein K1719_032943 [Acacia pycnantha]
MASIQEALLMDENGNIKELTVTETTRRRSARKMSSTWLRKKSDMRLISKVRSPLLRNFWLICRRSFWELSFPSFSLRFLSPLLLIAMDSDHLLGLILLAERISFLTEQIAYHTGPTVGGLLNATCLNATVIIIAMFALNSNKIAVVKYSLLGSILSNLLLVLGISLFSGGIANISRPQTYDSTQAYVNSLMLLLSLLCRMLPMLFRYATSSTALAADPSLQLSRASSIVMLIAYFAYLVFQLWTHRQLFEAQDDSGVGFHGGGDDSVHSIVVEYVVETIEDASDSWGLSKKRDISLGIALGSQLKLACLCFPSV